MNKRRKPAVFTVAVDIETVESYNITLMTQGMLDATSHVRSLKPVKFKTFAEAWKHLQSKAFRDSFRYSVGLASHVHVRILRNECEVACMTLDYYAARALLGR